MGGIIIRKKSVIHGIGVFTNKNIKKGEVFYEVPLDFIFELPEPRTTEISKGNFVSDNMVLNWINHSCKPSTILDRSGEIPKLIAARDIIAGEEITCDYDITEIGGAKLSCNCGNEKCRNIFLSRDADYYKKI
jgi:SET domain-containing protein